MPRKNNIPNNAERIEKIREKMKANYGKPIIVYGYFNSQAEACDKLGVSPAELNKAMRRNGQVHGLKVVKGEGVSTALTMISKFENK